MRMHGRRRGGGMTSRTATFLILSITCSALNCSTIGSRPEDVQSNRDSIAVEMRQVLDEEFARWYPLCIDTLHGGYLSDINSTWQPEGPQNKMIVTQARHVWSTSHAAMFYQKDNDLRNMAAHGVQFLRDTMWDREHGGFYDLVTRNGMPVTEDGQIIKRAYGNAFGIFGLAAYYRASGDTGALVLARKAFEWLEGHSYDPRYGGYFQFLSRSGAPFREGYRNAPPKDQNSMIHLLEAYTELFGVWPDEKLRERLHSLLLLIRDTITTERGYMMLSFKPDWTPISFRDSSSALRTRNYEIDHVSFGHDIETAYLMLEASEALGLRNDTTTLRKAKMMVDHTLRNGWDRDHGGISDGGYYGAGENRPSIVRTTKEWWSQAEALNSLLMMSQIFPDDTLGYFKKFCAQWEYCKTYVIDREHGGWYWGGVDIVPANRNLPKGTIWKADYHTSRALINCLRRFQRQRVAGLRGHSDPVNPNATPEARKLLQYLYSVSGTRILSGHHNYVGRIDTYPERVQALTGKRPAIWGCDFINYPVKGNAETIVREAYRKHQEGYIITLMWHAGRPQDDPPFGWKTSVQAKLTDREWEELLTPGSALNSRWQKQVDTIAGYLGELRSLGVPVLWRPYHELNGVWFWWGNRKGEKGSAALYRMMFERFVGHHKLNNLIWVWNTNAPRQLLHDEAYAYQDYFPGLEYVDVLAADVYHHDYRQSHHDDLAELGQGKVIALGEVGEVPSPENLVRQPRWTWFMIWGDFVDTHNTPEQIRDLYSYPKILTHEDVVRGR
jgi:mannobiose 2-epimerase